MTDTFIRAYIARAELAVVRSADAYVAASRFVDYLDGHPYSTETERDLATVDYLAARDIYDAANAAWLAADNMRTAPVEGPALPPVEPVSFDDLLRAIGITFN
jgi:hypothetical protein